MPRLGHAGRGERPDATAALLERLAAHDGLACLALRLSLSGVERALGAILIECLSRRVRLAVEVDGDGDPGLVANALTALAARLGKRRPRLGLVGAHVMLPSLDTARLESLALDPPMPPGAKLVGASAPLGAEPLLGLLAKGSEVIVCGPLSPGALAVALCRQDHRWNAGDHDLLAGAAAAGRILCAGAGATGGDLDEAPAGIGLPFVDIAPDGVAAFASTGSPLRNAGLALALLDGVRDPAAIREPDVTVDLADATLLGPNLSGVRGGAPADRVEGSLVFEVGHVAEAECAYGGTGAAARAVAAARELEGRLAALLGDERFRIEIAGLDAATKSAGERASDLSVVPSRDVRLRMAARTASRASGEAALAEFVALASFGPASAGGFTTRLSPERRASVAHFPRAYVNWRATASAADS
jgi:hypothetical protein